MNLRTTVRALHAGGYTYGRTRTGKFHTTFDKPGTLANVLATLLQPEGAVVDVEMESGERIICQHGDPLPLDVAEAVVRSATDDELDEARLIVEAERIAREARHAELLSELTPD